MINGGEGTAPSLTCRDKNDSKRGVAARAITNFYIQTLMKVDRCHQTFSEEKLYILLQKKFKRKLCLS